MKNLKIVFVDKNMDLTIAIATKMDLTRKKHTPEVQNKQLWNITKCKKKI